MVEILLWVLLTLFVATLSAVIGKKYGVEYIIGMYAAMVVIANVLASAKIVTFFIWAVDAGTIVYASLFLLTDLLSEIYGKKAAVKAVWSGFLANIMLILSVWIALNWTPAPFWEHQESFVLIFGNTWRIVVASLIAYVISQNHDIWAYHLLKKITKGKKLWIRNNISTLASQLIDTVIFTTIAFYGVYPVIPMIVGVYAVKMLIAMLDTPYLYAVKWYFKK